MGSPGRVEFMLEAASIRGIVARPEDADPIANLLIASGESDEWNHMPEAGVVRQWLAGGLVNGSVNAIRVVYAPTGSIIGAVTYDFDHHCPQYQPPERSESAHGYVSELVVSPEFRGRGIGAALLKAAIEDLTEMGAEEVYAIRHADNVGSGQTMEKTGMVVIDEFDDPKIRPTGSRRTTVTRFTRNQ